MTARLLPNLKTRYFDANGLPLAGGKLYSYEAGTNTPLATYTDSTGTVPNSNPAILDADGYADIWMGSATYKFMLTDANDVSIFTEDEVTGNLSNGQNGVDGRSLITGIIDPVFGDGNNGDSFINVTTSTFFGPKASGIWPSGISFAGANGTAIEEVLTGTYAAGNTTYTLSQTPVTNAEVRGVLGTVPQAQTRDYTISGTTITFTGQDTSDSDFLASYRYIP